MFALIVLLETMLLTATSSAELKAVKLLEALASDATTISYTAVPDVVDTAEGDADTLNCCVPLAVTVEDADSDASANLTRMLLAVVTVLADTLAPAFLMPKALAFTVEAAVASA